MDPTENKLKDISSVTSELLREKELNGSVKEFFFNELAYFSHEADPENPDDSDSPFRANLWQLLRFANMLTKKDITNRSEPHV